MSIITYKCDTCHRSVDVPQNKKGFEVYRNCIITLNCKGILSPTAVHSEYVRGNTTPVVANLTDWNQRLLLYKHTQQVSASVWKVTHNLNNIPDIKVFIYDSNDNLIIFTNAIITYVNANTITIKLPLKYIGVVECIAKYSNFVERITDTVNTAMMQLSNNHHLTFAVSKQYISPVLTLSIYSAGVNAVTITLHIPLTNNNALLPWGDVDTIYFNGKNYNVYTVDMSAIELITNISTYAFTISSLSTDTLVDSDIINHKGLIWILKSNGVLYSDKDLTSVLNVTKLTNHNNLSTNSITSVDSSAISKIYPTIKLI